MTGARKNHPSKFKSAAVLAMLREDAPLSELAVKYGVHGKMLQRWKREALSAMEAGFSDRPAKRQKSHESEVKDLHAKIGQLTVERDFSPKGTRGRCLQPIGLRRRQEMIEHSNDNLSIKTQCKLLSISRSGLYYTPKGESILNLKLMRLIDEQFMKTPFYGSRQMARHLRREGYCVSRHRVRRLMHKMGIQAIYQAPKTSEPHPAHKIYPYALKGLKITRPNQVWCTDITYIPIKGGFLYLIAIMDWYSRKVLSWRLSNTMEVGFCAEALEEALRTNVAPEIFNTDQGSQFTSFEFTNILKDNGIKISMDGKGRWVDNVFIERLWRSLKYECVYLRAIENGAQARKEIAAWLDFYNHARPHSTFDGLTPAEVYNPVLDIEGLAPQYLKQAA